jgi:hypothetical protein
MAHGDDAGEGIGRGGHMDDSYEEDEDDIYDDSDVDSDPNGLHHHGRGRMHGMMQQNERSSSVISQDRDHNIILLSSQAAGKT